MSTSCYDCDFREPYRYRCRKLESLPRVGEHVDQHTAPDWCPLGRAATIARLERDILLGRISDAEEHADGIVFLASDAASFMTGAVLDANGGGAMS